MAVLSASTIFAPGRKPPKAEIIQFLDMLQGTGSNPAVVKQTKAALDAVTPASETYGGLVLNDPDPTKNGYYYRSASAWVKGRGLPDSIAAVTLAGTANAQTGTASGVNPADVVTFFAVVGTENTGPMTLSIAGETPRDVVNSAGNALSAGEWTGAVLFFLNGDGDYQLLINPGAEAAAAQSASDASGSATAAAASAAAAASSVQQYLVVRAVADANIDISSALVNGASLDGLTLATGNTVLLTGQTDPSENGVYVVAATGAASRLATFNTFAKFIGLRISVGEGTDYARTEWTATSAAGGTIDVDDLDFAETGFTPVQVVTILNGISTQIARPEDYGGSIQLAMQSGKADVVLDGAYSISSGLTWTTALCPDLKRIINNGRGTVTATGPNFDILQIGSTGAGITRPIVEGFEGIGSFGLNITDQSNINNRGIVLIECENPRLTDIEFSRTKFMAVHNLGSNDVEIDGLRAIECGQAFYSRGGIGGSVRRILMRDTLWDETVFTIGVSLESTDGHSYGVPEDWSFDDIRMSGVGAAQGVMAHSGKRLQYSRLNIQDCVIGFSLNPASAAGANDVIQDVQVMGLNWVGPQVNPSGYSGGNSGVVVTAGAPTPDVLNVAMSNVNLRFGNAAEQNSSQAALQVWEARRFSLTGFSIENSYARAILIDNDVMDFAIAGGTIQGVTAVSTTQIGIDCQGTSDNFGSIEGVTIRSLAGANGVGIKRVSGHDVTIGDGVNYQDVTTPTQTV